MIVVFDFGSQTCHLISRRLRELGIESKILPSDVSFSQLNGLKPQGLILSGGPNSVYDKNSPQIKKEILKMDIPVLGICYGWQLIAHLLNGRVEACKKEYGPELMFIKRKTDITDNLPSEFRVWLSHGDSVTKLPTGFEIIASTKNIRSAWVGDFKNNIYGVQFHPEVEHTQNGRQILKNFVKICGLKPNTRKINIKKIIKEIKEKVGSDKVIAAVSGGIDSTTTAALLSRAIGNNFIPVYIDNGLMRKGTTATVKNIFQNHLQVDPVIVKAKELFLKELKGVSDPEEKRKIIGTLYIELFQKEAEKQKNIKYLAQGTIYSDVIESKGTKESDKIKSHHNVGGLPEEMDLKLIEPIRNFYKDEVRLIAKKLGLPENIVKQQPFPGPGQAIRIVGEVTPERLAKQHQADKILVEEIKKAGYWDKVFQCFTVMTGTKSTAVKGDARVLAEVVAVRSYESKDIMTAGWSKFSYELLQKISSRIVNEVPEVSRVVYDITTKPPATMEWE
jgi:GMP synthase (glutamine-hydrolysing)